MWSYWGTIIKIYSLEMSEIPFQFNQKIDYKAKN